jgi:hypothetical protein
VREKGREGERRGEREGEGERGGEKGREGERSGELHISGNDLVKTCCCAFLVMILHGGSDPVKAADSHGPLRARYVLATASRYIQPIRRVFTPHIRARAHLALINFNQLKPR